MGLLDRFKEAITSVVKKVETKTGVDLPGGYTKAEIRAPAPTPRPTAPAPAPKPTPTPAPAPKKKRSVTTRIKEAAVTAYTKADVAVGGLLPGGVTPQEAGGKVGEIIGQTYVKADIATGGLLPGGVTPQQVAGGVADIAKKVYTKTDVVVGGHLPGAEPTREQSYREGIIQEETQKIEQEKTDIIKETYTPDIQYTMPDTGKVVTGEEYRTMVEQDPYYSEENIRAVAQEAAAQPTYQTDVEGISTTVKEYEPVSDVGYVPQVKTFVSNIGAKVSSSWKGRVTYPAAERISSGIESVERYTGVDLPSTIEEAREHIVESTEFLESKGVSPWISRGGGFIASTALVPGEYVREKPLKSLLLVGAGGAASYTIGAVTAGSTAIGGVVAGAKGASVVGGAVKGVSFLGGAVLTGAYTKDVWGNIKEAPTYMEKGEALGTGVTEAGLFALGGVAGQQLWTKTQGRISTRGRTEIPTTEIVTRDVIIGKTEFPSSGKGLTNIQRAKQHKALFEEGKYVKRLQREGEIAGGLHAQGEPWYSKTVRPIVGEAPLHVSGKGVSTRFLRVGGETKLLDVKSFLGTQGKPSVKYVVPGGGYKARVATEVKRGIYDFTGKDPIKPGVGYVVGTKTEVQAIFTEGTVLNPLGKRFYFTQKGVRIPINEFKALAGKGITPVSGTGVKAAEFSYGTSLPKYSVITPSIFVPGLISKPATVSSVSRTSGIKSFIPKTSVISKSPTISSAPSFVKPSVIGSRVSTPSLVTKPSSVFSSSAIPKPREIIPASSYERAPSRPSTISSYKQSRSSSMISKPSYVRPSSSSPVRKPSSIIKSYTSSSRPVSSSSGYTSKSSSYNSLLSSKRRSSLIPSYPRRSYIKKRRPTKKKVLDPLFEVEVKRFGVWKRIGKSMGVQRAYLKGKDVVESTLGASFRIKNIKKGTFVKLAETDRFRKGKTDPFALVEKKQFRLSKKPEVSEIQTAKRKKKDQFFK